MCPLWRWTVTPEAAGERADRAIARAFERAEGEWEEESGDADSPEPPTRSRLQRLMEEGKVTGGSQRLLARDKLTAGQEIRVELPEPVALDLVPENVPFDILYEDEHLVVVNKPPGLTVHPSETQLTGTLVHGLLHRVSNLSGIGGKLRPGIVHRIDKDTSGALVVTKSDAAHRRLSEIFAAHDIERAYWALCYGAPGLDSGRIESRLGRNPNDRKKMAFDVEGGRRAVTHWKLLEAYGTAPSHASLIEARLETGRTHQVRVHLSHLGHSLLGDPVYGTPGPSAAKWKALPTGVRALVENLLGQALHARLLAFAHPITGKPIRVEAEPPAAFTKLLEELRERTYRRGP